MSPYTEHAVNGLPNPIHLKGEVRFVQAPDQQFVPTRSPKTVTECLLTRSTLIKMYVHVQVIYSRFYAEVLDILNMKRWLCL